jgi:hypothetical protein
MRLLICGLCGLETRQQLATVLAPTLKAWGVTMVVTYGPSPAAAWCRSQGVPVRELPAAKATLETLDWLFSLGSLDRILALPNEVPMDLYIRAFEHLVPVWELRAGSTRAELVPLTVGRARRRWPTAPYEMAG